MTKIDNQKLLISYLENGFNLSETAKALGVCRQTVSKRIKSDKFQALLTEYRKNLFQESSQILLENTLRASKTLARLLNSSSENVRLQSAVKILNLSCDYVTIDNLQQELNSLKEIINKE
jgi:hypothetical protein